VQGLLELSSDRVNTQWAIDVDPALEIVADRRHLLRALQNLCGNAMQAGATQLTIKAMKDDRYIHIDVQDNGPGLPLKAQDNLFQAFTGSSRQRGTVLGVVFGRDVAVEHGGDIQLVQTGPDGTCFKLRLPNDLAVHPGEI